MDRRGLAFACAGIVFLLGVASGSSAGEKPRFSYAPYAKVSAKRAETLRLVRAGRFDAVEALLVAGQQAYERGEADEMMGALGFAAFSTGDETLEPLVDRWVAQAPKSWSARLARARLLRQRYLRLAAIEGTVSEAAVGPASLAEYARRAIADYQAALAMNPRLIVAYSDLVEIASKTKDSSLLRESYRQALAVAPDTWYVRNALLHAGAVPREKRAAFLADAARHEKSNPAMVQLAADAAIDRAIAAANRGRIEEALAIYDGELGSLDTFVVAKSRAKQLRRLGRHAEALAAIDHAIALMPGKYEGHAERGWLHYDMKRYAEAAADFRRGLEIDPVDPELNRGLGWTLMKMSDAAGAARAWELSVRWEPIGQTYTELGRLYRKQLADLPKALVAYERATLTDPREPWAWYWRGEIMDKLGDPRAAESYSRYLAVVDAQAPEHQKHIAWAKHRMKAAKGIPEHPASPMLDEAPP
jgi:tetratricopeptide (TPR) repeat protein